MDQAADRLSLSRQCEVRGAGSPEGRGQQTVPHLDHSFLPSAVPDETGAMSFHCKNERHKSEFHTELCLIHLEGGRVRQIRLQSSILMP